VPRNARPVREIPRRTTISLARFTHVEAAGGLVLLAAAIIALVWANSPWSGLYRQVWQFSLPLTLGSGAAPTIGFGIDEGLMTLFFLVVGLELQREIRDGTLASARVAALPAIAAAGGIIVPALVYLAVDHGPLLRRGWAVPTPTDIAFAVGVLALLGPRVPRGLRALLLALAIIDDIGAILVIAFAYSQRIAWMGLVLVAAAVAAVLLLARLGVRRRIVYGAAGVVLWTGLLYAGVHPALAGVILGFLIPSSPAPDAPAESAASRLERALHPWVAYAIMPLFALSNAGVDLHGIAWKSGLQARLVVGVALGLACGKPIGILLATLAAVKLRLSELPRGVTARGVMLVGCLGGIGFTMSIFIADLAFAEPLRAAAKLGTLVGSACAALLGLALGRWLLPERG
jgi:Na+:H+ antiporter, NhaA family